MDAHTPYSSLETATPGFAALLWRRKWTIAGLAAAGLLLAVIWLQTVTYRYAASLKLTPVQANTPTAGGGLGGLASLAGVSIGRGEVVKPFVLYLQLMKGRTVAAELARDPALMRHVFAAAWDSQNRVWREPPSLTRGPKNFVKRLVGLPVEPWRKPGAAEVEVWLGKRLGIGEDPKNGLATATLQDRDPDFATTTLTRLHELADDQLRARTLARTTAYIAYLKRTLPTVTLMEHQAALAKSLAAQEESRMIASATGTAFAAEPLGRATVSTRPVAPDPWTTLAAGLFGGLLIGALLALNLPAPRRRAVLD